MATIGQAVTAIFFLSIFPAICCAEDKDGDDSQEYTFNSNFIVGSASQADLTRFNTSNLQPGTYSIDVYNNDEWKGLYELKVTRDAKGRSGICYTAQMLEQFGVDLTKLNKPKAPEKDYCAKLSEWSDEPAFKDNLSSSQLRLDLSVPQRFENEAYQGYIAPESWDKGITGLNINYAADYYDILQAEKGGEGKNAYLGVHAYLSSAGWQLRHTGNVNWKDDTGAKWTSNETTLQRPLPPLKSLLTLGQFGSSGDFFDSVNLLGVNLATDTMMYPDNVQTYAPVINGVAETNALVTVHQNNSLIYQTTVAPGPFSLRNVYPAGSGSDLIVTIHEADGREKSYAIPYNSVVKLLHPGMSNYTLTVGKANDESLQNKPVIGQGTWRYGLNNTFTLYGGATGYNDYQAWQAGSGINTLLGGLAFDATQADARLPVEQATGQQYRLLFTRTFTASQTGISLQASQASKHYYSLASALYIADSQKRGITGNYAPQRSNISYMISQQFPDGWGGLYFSGSFSRYWKRSGTEEQYSLGYSNTWGKLNWGVSLQRVYTNSGDNHSNDETTLLNGLASSQRKKEDTIALTFSYPLSFGEDKNVSLSSNSQFKNGAFNSAQLGLDGALNKENTLTYGLSSSIDNDHNYNLGMNGGYIAPWSALSASYSYGKGYQQAGASANGTVLVHAGGVTLSSETGSTLTLAEAKGAKGASIAGTTSRFDSNGYALVSSLQPYRVNNIEVDMKGASDDVNLDSTTMQVVPYEGSITKVTFKTKVEKTRIIVARRAGNIALPFGAEITDENGKSIGFVGQGSSLYITSESAQRARVGWDGGQCEVRLAQSEIKEQICV